MGRPEVDSRKRHATLPLVIVCLLAACATAAPGAYAATYSGGSGTSGDPYLISTPQDLVDLANVANSADWDITFYQRDPDTMD